MKGTRCWIAHSATELRDVPRAHLATGKAHAVAIYPSGMPRKGLCYYTLINIMAYYILSNNIEKLCTNDVLICNNNVIMKQSINSPGLPRLLMLCFIITLLFLNITSLLYHYYIIIAMSIMEKMMNNML